MGKLSCLFINVLMTSVIYAATTHIAYNELQRGWVYSWDQDCLVLCGCTNMPKSGTLNIPSTLDTYLGPVAISKIAERAFAGCKTLSAVSIPDSVEEIGDYAFSRCENLQTVSMPGNALQHIGVSAFGQCSMLCDFKFPSSVISIGRDAFFRCEGLRSLALPDSIEVIGERAFGACSNLDVTNIPNGIEIIGTSAFEGTAVKSVDLPESLVAMGANSFAFCGDLQSVVIRASMDAIQMGAFYSCSNLETVAIAEGVKEIQLNAFEGDIRLTSVVLPSTLVEIGEDAFRECDLKELALPKSLKVVGAGAFVLNRDIREMCILSEDLTVCGRSFEPVQSLVLGSEFKNFELLQNENAASVRANDIFIQQGMTAIPASAFRSTWCNSIFVPESVTSIGNNAFYACRATKIVIEGEVNLGASAFEGSSIQDIELKIGTSTIPERLFYGCGVLSNVVLSSSVERIEDEAFYGCESLMNLNWPEQLKYIGKSAFAGCEALTNLNLKATQVEEIGERAFFACWSLIDPVIMPVTLKYVGDTAFYMATIWTNLSVVSSQAPPNSTINFLGLPPVVGDNVFATAFQYGGQWYVYNGIYRGTYVTDYAVEWEKAIEDWSKEHQTDGKWAWLEFSPQIVVEPTAWEMDKPKTGDQSLTIAWHLPTNDNLTVEQAMAELKAKNLTYAVWRSGDDPKEYANFRESVCVAQNVTDVKWLDEKFGEIKGTHPVRYWVEIQEEKNAKGDPSNRKRPVVEPVFCTTRRRFGIVVGVSDYERHWWSVGTLDGYQSWASWFWLSSLPEPRKEAIKFESLMRESGAVVEEDDLLCLIDGKAQLDAVRSGWRKFSEKKEIKPGDMMFFYVSTHGEGGAGAYHGGGVMLHDHRYAKDELEEDIRMFNEKHPDVRVVNTVMACHSGGLVKAIGKNVAWIYSCGKDELSSSIGKTYSMFGTAFLEYGWEKLSANNSIVRGYWDEPCYTAPEAGDVTLFNLAEYSRRLAFGLSSKVPSHVDVLNGSLLKTINMVARRESFRENPPAPISKLEVFSADCMTCVAWTGNEDAEYYVVKYEEEESGGVDYVTINRHAGLRFETVNFQDDAKYYNPISHDKPYKISVAAVNRAGIGPFSRVVEFPNVDLPPCVYSVHEISGNAYVGSVSYPFEFSDVEVQASVADVGNADVASVEFTFSHEEGVTNFSCLASFNTNGIIMCSNEACCVYAALTPKYICGTVNGFHFAARNVDCEIETLGSAYSCGEEIAITCISKINDGVFHAKNMPKGLSLDLTTGVITGIPTVPGSYVVLVTVKSKTDPTQTETIEVPIVIGNYVDETIAVDDEYGPFVPGEKVELKFADGAAWKVTGLPTGLKWDAKLPGVTGVPTKPGTNTVYFTWTDKTVTPNVTHKASSTFIVGPLPVLSVQTAGEGTGKVSGAGAYAANKKVTLKATADTKDAAAKGKIPATVKSVFAGWYDATGELVAQTPSLSYVMPPYDVTLQARFIPASNDWATADCVTDAGSVLVVSNETKVAIAPISVVAAGGSLPTVKVAGLPTGLKFTAKDILKKGSKTEIEIPANTIYGTPTKGGVYNATVTVTTAGKASVVRAIKFIIRTSSDYVVDADWDPVLGKVTGAGVYQAGKKVTLKATANKGYVFNGWYAGADLLSQAASYAFTMPTEDVAYEARFVTAEEDKASIAAGVNGMSFGVAAESGGSTASATNVMCGVYLEWPVAASALSETTVKVAGLPTGLKFTAKPVTSKVGTGNTAVTVTNVPANTIYGAPSAASKTDKKGKVTPSKVKVTVTTVGKSKSEYVIDLAVDPLPAWAQGEFSGLASMPEGRLGIASMSVTAAGKVSGKVIVNGTNVSFTATSYDITSKTVGETNLVALVTGKLGKEAVTGGITVVASGASGSLAGADMTLFRNVWKDKGADPVPVDAQGLYTVKLGADERGTGYLSLTVDKKGAVKVTGKAPDGTALSATATLIPSGTAAAPYFADIFAALSAYKGGYVAGRFGWDADGRVSSDGLDWTSFNPQSTADYYAGGFARTLEAHGTRYVKADAPKKLTVADVRLEKPEGTELKTFSFAQSTGIWKGTLLLDFGDLSLNPVKVPFEGIMVQGEDLDGFGMYDVQSRYIPYDKNGKPQKEKTYKAKESLPVRFIDSNKDM